MQLKWYLRAIANAILDQAIHVDGMARDEAMKLMTQTTFQQESEAAGKVDARATDVRRSCRRTSSAARNTSHLRARAEKRWGKDFELKRYHDTVPSFGSPPVRYVRELMFDEPVD